MTDEWFQLWVDIPLIGRQWGGWIRATRFVAQGLVETFATSAVSSLGFKWTLLDAQGASVQAVVPGLEFPGFRIPGLTL
jgi:hypothetical protein